MDFFKKSFELQEKSCHRGDGRASGPDLRAVVNNADAC